MKAKGLQRLRWYCQVCEKQCRDENGFKCHTQSESHLHKMLNVSARGKEKIEEYSTQFKRDFIFLLRTGHGEKSINANRFYQEYIQNKDHIHMNATKWTSLTDFVKFLGKEGICRVEDSEENGLCISWIDNSPESLRRQEALRKKERAEKGDEYRAMKHLETQVQKAKEEQVAFKENSEEGHELDTEIRRESDSPISLKLSFASNRADKIAVVTKSSSLVKNTGNQAPRKNVFATPSISKVSKPKSTPSKSNKPLNAFQEVMLQEQARRRH
ncbi:Rts2p [Sugiyamaella lignohabitans]|uniref:Rts2p n=1 Tax=Sugiyamaella lignohabitans TaxID=796027 RepID=A0A167FVU8_9ASCO|nr:Rts2p [Sugiyamaella lignohabitans]ANB15764.1 Rts2p [Sugiyamaella lignohabitans]